MSVSKVTRSTRTVGLVKYRRPLNSEQIAVLEWLYKVRFSTSRQIAITLKKSSHKAIQDKLQTLEAQNLIGKRYNKSYKLAGRAAEYYLTPAGGRWLARYIERLSNDDKKKHVTIHNSIIKALYKNKTVSDSFIQHCLKVADTIQTIEAFYGNKLLIFTASELAPYEQFPTWRPDLYLSLKPTNTTERQRYFLDIWDDTQPFFVNVRKIRNYIKDEDEGNWYEDTPYPYILAVCKNTKTQKKLNKQIVNAINDTYSELTFATTTIERLQNATKSSEKIWSRVDADGDNEELSLKNIYFVTP
jgi:DNA-binding PadR family transcriptional regulator